MNQERGSFAAAAGLGALALFVVSGFVFVFSLVIGRINPVSFGGTSPDPTTINHVGMFVLAPAIAAVGAALPVRALGAGWPVSAATSVAAVALVFLSFSAGAGALPLAAANALAPAIAVMVGAAGRGLTEAGVKILLTVTAAFFVAGFVAFVYGTVWGFVLVLPAWVVLPTIAGLHQTR